MSDRPPAGGGMLRAHLGLARISNTPTTISNVLAGAVLAAPLVFNAELVLIIIAVALFYTAGMYLNDILDVGIDREQRPDRPLASGRISMGAAWAVTLMLFIAGLGLLWFVDRQSFIAGVVLIGVIAFYDAWHKGNTIGPVIMAFARVMVYVVAFFAFASEATGELWLWGAVMLAYVSGLTYIAKTESLPGVGRYWPLATVIAPAVVAVIIEPRDVLVWSLAVAHVLWVLHSASFAFRSSNRQVGGAIARLIAGISMLDALVLATHESWWGVLVAMGCLALTMFLQRYIKGT
jgi:4-hydroxybenzoate polyprenyltransferase